MNVVIYRLPREKSLVRPGSCCPACGRHIRFYDNIPLISWLVLRAKCRYCKARISPRYFVIELLTGLVFTAIYILYFHTTVRTSVMVEGGWFVYLLHLVMVAGFIAASAIDLELWIIPLSICWFVTLAGLVGSAVGPYIVHPSLAHPYYFFLPQASTGSGAMAVGAAAGLGISWLLLITGVFKRSYDVQMSQAKCETGGIDLPQGGADPQDKQGGEPRFNHRLESLREIVFLAPIIVCSVAALWISRNLGPVRSWWTDIVQYPAAAGLLGSLWGYFVGCGVVWATRILGTLAFGKEAMGLGDVHLMGAAGAVVGPIFVVLAFFIAPFFGLAWVCFQMFFRKIRQIPYGPFLSLGVVAVMILHDWILSRFGFMFYCR